MADRPESPNPKKPTKGEEIMEALEPLERRATANYLGDAAMSAALDHQLRNPPRPGIIGRIIGGLGARAIGAIERDPNARKLIDRTTPPIPYMEKPKGDFGPGKP